MPAKQKHNEPTDRGASETTAFMIRRALKISGIGAILTFAAVIGLSLPLKAILGTTTFLLWVGFEIILKKNIRILSSAARRRDVEVRSTLLGIVFVIFLAAVFKEIENRLTPPDVGAESIYYVIVLDASEQMNSPFEGHTSKWGAVQSAFEDFFTRSNQLSKYGLVVIGGQNPKETKHEACTAPSVPLLPLVSGKRVLQDLSLTKLRTAFELQRPQGTGSLSRGFFLAKNQLETLPLDKIKIIVLVASSSDVCEGSIDWDALADKIQLVNKAIAIHKELILLDEIGDPRVAAFADKVKQTNQPIGNSNTYVQVAYNYYQLTISITNVLERLDSYLTPTQLAEEAGMTNTQLAALSTLDEDELAPGINKETKNPVIPRLTSVIPTNDISIGTQHLPLSTRTAAIPVSTNSCTPTSTFTPIITSSPTLILSPAITTYPTVRPTKKKSDRPAPTNPPRPPENRCCKHCGTGSKPCGDSCIALNLTCHKPKGCACP